MTFPIRLIAVVVLLLFAWKGSVLDIRWPPAPAEVIDGPKPEPNLLAWAESLRGVVPRMLPADRMYLANLYDAMSFVLLRDGRRADGKPILSSTDKFRTFHIGTLQLAIDKDKVGQYPGLDDAIDEVFVLANGPEIKPIDEAGRAKLIAACQVLAWTFGIHRDE